MVGGKGTAEIATRYPLTTGSTARTTKQTGKNMVLIPQGLNGLKSTVLDRERVGIG